MAISVVASGFASSSVAYSCEGLFCNQPHIIWGNAGPEDDVVQDKTLAECRELCVLDDANQCLGVVHNAVDKTCQRIKYQPGAPGLPSDNFWTYVPNLGDSIRFQPSELQWAGRTDINATANQCQAFMLDVNAQEFSDEPGQLIAQWTPDHGDTKQFVHVGPYFGRPAINEVTAAYMPPPPPTVLNATLGMASAPLYLQVTQEKHSNGDTVVGLTADFPTATKFEFSNGGITRGSECFRLARTTGMHAMELDGGADQVQKEPKCSGFPNNRVPYGGPAEWKMVVNTKQWCLADPVQVNNEWKLKEAINIDKDGEKDCSDRWQISSSGLRSGLDFAAVGATGKCELFKRKGAALRSEESSTSSCPNINGMWNIHYPFPGILDYKAQIQVSGNVGTMTIEENDLVYHFAIQAECRRIRFCVTPVVMPDDVSCTTVGTFFEGTLDSAGNTISWDDAAFPQWTNAFPLHNKCPNMPYYACATGPLHTANPQAFPCSFTPDYNKCGELCKNQPNNECHFCSDGSCIPGNQYII